jgi:hypothetical protein
MNQCSFIARDAKGLENLVSRDKRKFTVTATTFATATRLDRKRRFRKIEKTHLGDKIRNTEFGTTAGWANGVS